MNVSAETLLTFAQAAASLPGKPHVSTIHRWRLRGCRGIKLETILIGGVRYTSAEALQRFFDCTTAAADGTAAPQTRTPARRQSAILQAESELQIDGI